MFLNFFAIVSLGLVLVKTENQSEFTSTPLINTEILENGLSTAMDMGNIAAKSLQLPFLDIAKTFTGNLQLLQQEGLLELTGIPLASHPFEQLNAFANMEWLTDLATSDIEGCKQFILQASKYLPGLPIISDLEAEAITELLPRAMQLPSTTNPLKMMEQASTFLQQHLPTSNPSRSGPFGILQPFIDNAYFKAWALTNPFAFAEKEFQSIKKCLEHPDPERCKPLKKSTTTTTTKYLLNAGE